MYHASHTDLSGYITEGQIVIQGNCTEKDIYPPVQRASVTLRLMNSGIGATRTRKTQAVSDQLYAAYAEGKDLRGLVAIVGRDALSDRDKKFLEFAIVRDRFVRPGHG